MSSNHCFVTPNSRGLYPSARRTWSAEHVRELRELAEQGVCVRIIAARLRKTESAVRNKAGMLGISISQRDARNERPSRRNSGMKQPNDHVAESRASDG